MGIISHFRLSSFVWGGWMLEKKERESFADRQKD